MENGITAVEQLREMLMALEEKAATLQEEMHQMRGIVENLQKPLESLLESRLLSLEENMEAKVLEKLDNVLQRLEATQEQDHD